MESQSNTACSVRELGPKRPPHKWLSLVETRCILCGFGESEPAASGHDFEYATAQNLFQFVRCRNCGHLYLNPRPASADLGVIYPSNYYAFARTRNQLVARVQRYWEAGKVRLYRQSIGLGPRRILEVGCGNGRFLELLREYGPPEWEIVGIDLDENAVHQCVSRGFEAHVSRIEDFKAENEAFDGVIMLQLIEHVEDPAEICSRVHALLRPGGCFIIETPNLGGLDYRIFKGTHWGHYHFPRHWNLFSTQTLHRLLAERGFSIARSEYLISASTWIISLHNYLLDKGFPGWIVRFFSYQNPLLLSIFVTLDWVRARLGFATSNQRVVAVKQR